jgi:hypothetical protein
MSYILLPVFDVAFFCLVTAASEMLVSAEMIFARQMIPKIERMLGVKTLEKVPGVPLAPLVPDLIRAAIGLMDTLVKLADFLGPT